MEHIFFNENFCTLTQDRLTLNEACETMLAVPSKEHLLSTAYKQNLLCKIALKPAGIQAEVPFGLLHNHDTQSANFLCVLCCGGVTLPNMLLGEDDVDAHVLFLYNARTIPLQLAILQSIVRTMQDAQCGTRLMHTLSKTEVAHMIDECIIQPCLA